MPVQFLARPADPLGMLTGKEGEVLALVAEARAMTGSPS